MIEYLPPPIHTLAHAHTQSVDIKNEKINLESTEVSLDADSLPSHVPDTSPRYHLYRYFHRYNGDDQESVGVCVK